MQSLSRLGIAAMGAVALGGWLGVPVATADNPVCTSTWCTFLSPTRNISCELNYNRGSGISDETYCQTNSPPQSVRMTPAGTFRTCNGDTCLGNPGQGTPTLGYGQSASVGPFSCRSESNGVTCTGNSGHGFTISATGVTSVG